MNDSRLDKATAVFNSSSGLSITKPCTINTPTCIPTWDTTQWTERVPNKDKPSEKSSVTEKVPSSSSQQHMRSFLHAPYCHSVPCREKLAGDNYAESRKHMSFIERDHTKEDDNSVVIDDANDRYYEGIKTEVLNKLPTSTRLKTRCDVAVLLGYLRKSPRNDTRDIEDIPPQELDKYLVSFFKSIKKTNGEDYHSVTMPSFMGSFNRYLKILNYPFSMFTSCLFYNTRRAMVERRNELADAGYGKRSSPIMSLENSDINILKERKTFGTNHPVPLLNFIIYSNCIHFKIKKVTDHYRLLWSNFKLRINSKGREYVLLERQGAGGQTTRIRVNAKPAHQALCPVALYKAFKERRPILCVPEFYLVPIQLPRFNKYTPVWFRNARMGKNALAGIMNKLQAQAAALQAHSGTSTDRPKTIAETSEYDRPTTTTREVDRPNDHPIKMEHTPSVDVALKKYDADWRSHSPKCNQMKHAAVSPLSTRDDGLELIGISSSNNASYGSSKGLCHDRPIIIRSFPSGQEQSKNPLSSNSLQPGKQEFQQKPFTDRLQRDTKSVKRKQSLNDRGSKVMRIAVEETGNMLSLMPNLPSSTSDETSHHRKEKHVSQLCPYTGRFLVSSTATVNTATERRSMLAGYESSTHCGFSETIGYTTSKSELSPLPVSLISVQGFQEIRHVGDTTRIPQKRLVDYTHEVSATRPCRDLIGSSHNIRAKTTSTSTSLSQICSSRINPPSSSGPQFLDCTPHFATGSACGINHVPRKENIGHLSMTSEMKRASSLPRPMTKPCDLENNIFPIMSNVRTADSVVDNTSSNPDSSINLTFSPMKLATKTMIESLYSGSPLENKQKRKDPPDENLPVIVSVRSLAGTGNCPVKCSDEANNPARILHHPQVREDPIKPLEEIANEDEQEMLALQTFSSHIYCLPDQNARLPNLVCPSERDWQTIEEHTQSGFGFSTAPVERRIPDKLSLLAGHSVEKYHRLLLELFPLLSDRHYSVYCRVTDDEHGPLVMVDLHELKEIPPFLFVIPYKQHERRPLPILVSLPTTLRSESPESRKDEGSTSLLKSLVQDCPNQLAKHLHRMTSLPRRPSSPSDAAKPNGQTQKESKTVTTNTSNDKDRDGKTPDTVTHKPKVKQTTLQVRSSVISEAFIPIVKTEDGTQNIPKGTSDKNDIGKSVSTFDYTSIKLIQDKTNQQNNERASVPTAGNIDSTPVNESEMSPLNNKTVSLSESKRMQMKPNSPLTNSNIRHADTFAPQYKLTNHSERETPDLQMEPEKTQEPEEYRDRPNPFECFIRTSDAGVRVLVDAKEALAVPESHVHCEILQVRSDHYLQDVYNFYKTLGPATNYTLVTKLKTPDKRFLIHFDTTIMFFRFWQLAVKVWFKGHKEFVPTLSPTFDEDCFTVLGTILAHGLVHCSFWPVQISRACAVFIVTGSQSSHQLLKSSFLNCIPDNDAGAIEALLGHPSIGSTSNTGQTNSSCDPILSRYGYTDTPTPSTIDTVIQKVCRTHMLHRPYFALIQMNRALNDLIKSRRLVEQDVIDMYKKVEQRVGSIQRHADIFFYKHDHP